MEVGTSHEVVQYSVSQKETELRVDHYFDTSTTHNLWKTINSQIKKNIKGGTIYVARVNRQGNPMISRPCDRCYEAIVDAGITKIVYTD